MEIQYGFMEITYSGEDGVECADTLCTRFILPEHKCFIDVQEDGKIYCSLCGLCERYHRKKAIQREEAQ